MLSRSEILVPAFPVRNDGLLIQYIQVSCKLLLYPIRALITTADREAPARWDA
jgi:hypothetical protein